MSLDSPDRFWGINRYVADEMGYAPLAVEFRMFVVGVMGNDRLPAAALIDEVDGATKSELFLPLTLAKPSFVDTANWYST